MDIVDEKIKNLVGMIKYNAKIYYEGHPEISDKQFDDLLGQLRFLDPSNEVLTTVGWGYSPSDTSDPTLSVIPHKYDLAKFEGKIYDPDLIKIPYDKRVVTPKYDGGSVILYYTDGILTNAVSRGNGKEGFDITANFSRIVPVVLEDRSFTGMIRGEGIMYTDTFEKKYSSTYKNARNLSTGWEAKSGISDNQIKDMSFLAYTVRGKSTDYSEYLTHKHGVLDWLKLNKFDQAKELEVNDWSIEALKKIIVNYRKLIGIDGIVITSENYDKMDDGTYVPNREVAYKVRADKTQVKVNSIKWDLTRTSKLVPVVHFNPIELSGATVSRATGFNASFIKKNKIGKDSIISVQRSGEVIPNIVETIVPSKEVTLPTKCPSCGEPLVQIGTDLWCKNNECPSYLKTSVSYYIEVVGNIKGLGGSVISSFIDYFSIDSVKSLYKFDWSRTTELTKLDGIGSHSLDLLEKLHKVLSGKVLYNTFLRGLNIKGLSGKSAEKLEGLYSITDRESQVSFINNSKVNKTVKSSLLEDAGLDLINEVSPLVDLYLDQSEKLDDSDYVGVSLTGKLSVSRKEFLSYLETKGFKEVNISKASILITDNPDKSSSKNKIASSKGIPKVSEESLRDYTTSGKTLKDYNGDVVSFE